MIPPLIIDPEFRDLIPPLSRPELENLEKSLLSEGCREPIVVWEGLIIDGHHRYEICLRHGIPFEISSMCFNAREDAVSWICLNQLGRRNLSEEAYRYLIGKRYEAEKVILQRKNAGGFNQYRQPPSEEGSEMVTTPEEKRKRKEQHRTSVRLGSEYRIDHSTVESYARFSRALDIVEHKAPGFRQDVLSGAIHISKTNIAQMAEMPEADVQTLSDQLRARVKQADQVTLQDSCGIIDGMIARKKAPTEEPVIVTGIKQMPVYDPDAVISGLLLTAPTWTGTILRLVEQADFSQISEKARRKLYAVLRELESATSKLQHKAGIRGNGH